MNAAGTPGGADEAPGTRGFLEKTKAKFIK